MQALLLYLIFVKSQGFFPEIKYLLIYNLIAKVSQNLKLTK